MSCQRCKSDRILHIHGKCSDMFDMEYKGVSGNGYVPKNLFFGIDGYGDYVEMDFCLECGQIQSKFPVSESAVKVAMEDLSKED